MCAICVVFEVSMRGRSGGWGAAVKDLAASDTPEVRGWFACVVGHTGWGGGWVPVRVGTGELIGLSSLAAR